MFVEINGKYLNTHYVSSMKKSTEEIDGQTKYVVNFTLTNGANIKQVFDSQAEADEKYEEVEKSGGGGSGPSTNVYVYRGSCLFADLPSSGNTAGDVYNIEDDFELGGKTYYAGTNVAWKGDGWDPLAGTIDTSIFETKSNKTNTIDENSTNEQYAGAKAVYDVVSSSSGLKQGAYKLMYDSSGNDKIILDNLKPGIYYFGEQRSLSNWYIQRKSNSTGSEVYKISTTKWWPYIFILNESTAGKVYNTLHTVGYILPISANTGNIGGFEVWITANGSVDCFIKNYMDDTMFVGMSARLLTLGNQNIEGTKTFNSIPKQANTNAPTQDAEFTNKKYVDDQIAEIPAPDMSNYYTKDEVDALFEEKLGDIETIVDAILDGSANAENMEF